LNARAVKGKCITCTWYQWLGNGRHGIAEEYKLDIRSAHSRGQFRRWRGVNLAPGAAMAAKHAGTQTAEQFVLVDAGASRRAVMRATPHGTAYLAMYDGHGRDRAEFHVAKDGGASIGFYDQSGSQRVLVGEAPGGRNGLAIYSNAGAKSRP
jgi:hypothetical protein